MSMCTCAVHCPRSPYHESACCTKDCNCWCHKKMTPAEVAIANILLAVAQQKTTVAQLRRKLADGLAYVARVGAKNCKRSLIEELAAIGAANTRFEADRVKYDPVRNN